MTVDENIEKATTVMTTTSPVEYSESYTVSRNLAILPVLAVLIFLTYLCLKCCHWFRESLKDKDDVGDVENSGFIILNEGDEEYNAVEFRSDTNSCYDTVSSYTSFIKSNNHYDTVTSIRSLQVPKQQDIYNSYNSYRSFLMHRLDGSKYNTVNSVRSFLQNSTEMKDAEIQVELVNMGSERPNSPAIHGRRHYSIDAIPPRAQPSLLESYSDGHHLLHQSLRRSHRHHVSFADNQRLEESRSLSVDASHKPLIDSDVYKNTKTYSLKHLWGIKDHRKHPVKSRNTSTGALPENKPSKNHYSHHMDSHKSPTTSTESPLNSDPNHSSSATYHQTDQITSSHSEPNHTSHSQCHQNEQTRSSHVDQKHGHRPHRFKVCKANEALSVSGFNGKDEKIKTKSNDFKNDCKNGNHNAPGEPISESGAITEIANIHHKSHSPQTGHSEMSENIVDDILPELLICTIPENPNSQLTKNTPNLNLAKSKEIDPSTSIEQISSEISEEQCDESSALKECNEERNPECIQNKEILKEWPNSSASNRCELDVELSDADSGVCNEL